MVPVTALRYVIHNRPCNAVVICNHLADIKLTVPAVGGQLSSISVEWFRALVGTNGEQKLTIESINTCSPDQIISHY
tara:strand:+ start:297 stop:527 length:231 start_codon:yes stop_codon:yes gene_type:complete